MSYLTFALAKGRVADEVLEMLGQIGFTCDEMDEKSRKLIFVNEELKLKFFLAKTSDVPTYVEYGAADLGVCGKDTLLEENRNIYEIMDLGLSKCRIIVAGTESVKYKLETGKNLVVATKYPNIATDFFYNKRNQTVEIIKLNGSVELGPIVGLSDCIVDLVATGETLRANGLTELMEVCKSSARIIANRVSMKMEHERIAEILIKLRKVVERFDNGN